MVELVLDPGRGPLSNFQAKPPQSGRSHENEEGRHAPAASIEVVEPLPDQVSSRKHFEVHGSFCRVFACLHNPSSSAMGLSASIRKAMCSGRGRPTPSAPP